jgi:predicted nucleic acid-binding protein
MISAAEIARKIRGKRVLIDTNIIIYLTDRIAPYVPLSRQIFDMLESGETEAVLSILSISEVMQGPILRKDIRIAMEVKEYLTNFPNSHCQEITHDVLNMVGAVRGVRSQFLTESLGYMPSS